MAYNRRLNTINGFDGLAATAVAALVRQGCRKVGMICSLEDKPSSGDPGDLQCHQFHERFRKLAQENGLELRPEWIRTPATTALGKSGHNGFSYRCAQELWASTEKPDGLFVYTDDLVMGTLLALSQASVRIPQDLKLALHHNQECPVFCPVPCAFVENSVAELAGKLVDIVDDLFHGRQPKGNDYQYHISIHPGD